MYACKCKHGKIVAGTIGIETEGKSIASISSEYIDFAVFITKMLDSGYIVSKQDSVTLEMCDLCRKDKEDDL